MNRMEEARKQYEEIMIPPELSVRVQSEIEKAEKRRRQTAVKKLFHHSLAAAAAAVVLFTAALNTSVTFAHAAEEIPVIGMVAKVLTFRSYETKTEDYSIAVDIPSIEMISGDFKNLEQSVNSEIHRLCELYAEESIENAMEYRKAFLDTGGTVEEWKEHKIEIKVWYDVKSQSYDFLSLAVHGRENWNNAGRQSRYYNFDLKNGKLISLKDVLGDNYSQTAVEQVKKQMEERGGYFQDALPDITEETSFYMNEAGNPVIVFEPYEVAPGSAGVQEFEIKAR